MFLLRRGLSLWLCTIGLLAAEALQAAAPKAAEEVANLLQDREYAKAVEAIGKLQGAEQADRDYLLYLKGRALHLQRKYDEAIAAFDQMNREFPDSQWARQARFAKGLSYARNGDFRNAELAYRSEAEYLFSEDRKQEIADIYLEYADTYFDPPEENQEPDYEKARDFYQRALNVGPKPDSRIRVELLVAQCQQKLEEYADAADRYRRFIDDNQDHPLVVEARYQLGETLLAADENAAAREAWQDLLDLHRGSTSDLLPQAAFRIAETYQIPQPNDDESLSMGVAALRRYIERYPNHALASQAELWIGQSYHHRDRLEDATTALTQLLSDDRYAKGEEIPVARNLLGNTYLMQSRFDDALRTWQEFLTHHPTDQAWSDVQQQIVNAKWAQAIMGYQHKEYDHARTLFTSFLADYPLDKRGLRIQYLFGEMNYAEEKWALAIADWQRLVSKYPKSQEASQAQFMIGHTMEEKLGQLEKALDEYRKLDWGKYTGEAKRRIARLTAKTLQVATERVFRSDETPQLKLNTRNIECVTVRVYTVDMETYFRKMHQARGVESLDISLIDPDQIFEYKVPDYKPHFQHDSTIDVPLPIARTADGSDDEADSDVDTDGQADTRTNSGVMAVTISSKTLEATTMILQSDLDVIIKSSRDEALVFAENMRTGQPWPGARILFSNGDQVFAEGRTGDDGVFHKVLDDLESAEDLRVFAIANGHIASNVLGLSGLGVAQGLRDKGYVYTDRPAYQPGQMVHVRGVIRKESGDTYTVVEGKSYDVDVYDSRNRLVHDATVKLNQFGSFHLHLLLPSAASQGQYRILVQDKDQESYQGAFAVYDYRLEPIRVEIDTPRSVYYRGETIEGVVRAAYYYGAPLVDREVRYGYAGGRQYAGRTDEKGEVHFRLETRQFRESQPIVLQAELAERNLTAAKNFYLSAQGFSLAAETVRDVFLAGETFELTVTAADAEGEPLQQPLGLDVLRQTEVDGRTGEVSVQKLDIATDAEGLARSTLKIDEGGVYILRVSGTDRFDNTIETQLGVRISDDEDETRLRILADQHTFKVGDTAQLQVHWREQSALALVTFQGAKILDYRLVRLKKGRNELAVPMDAKLAPNFDLSVAVMTDMRSVAKGTDAAGKVPKRFHEASSPFTVQRELNVAIKMTRAGDGADDETSLQPGGKVRATVTATDAQGKPVSAELSLAMVEQALLRRFPSPVATIEDFFRSAHRQSAVRTTSSVTFSYRPKTQQINSLLLAEADRMTMEEEEGRRLAEMTALAEDFRAASRFRAEVADPFADSDAYAVDDNANSMDLDFFVEDRPGIASGGTSDMAGGGYGGFGNHRGEGQMAASSELMNGGLMGGLLGGYGWPKNLGSQGGEGVYEGLDLRTTQLGTRVYSVPSFANGSVAEQIANGRILAATDGTLSAITDSGVFAEFSGNGRDLQGIQDLMDAIAPDGLLLLPHLPPHQTGYWNPSVVTSEDGTATVTFILPDRSTGWTLAAKAITEDTLAGETSHDFAVRGKLFGQLKLPGAFTDGDSADVAVSVHNDVLSEGEIDVALSVQLGDKTTTEHKTVQVTQKGIHEVMFKQQLTLSEDVAGTGDPGVVAEFELTVSAGQHRNVVRRSVPVRPFGLPVYSTAGGSAVADALVSVGQPNGMKMTSPRLQILIGPTVERSLLDAVLAPATWCQMEAFQIATDGDATAADLMASLALQTLLGGTRDAAAPQAESLDARIRSSISLLVALQDKDGGWGWADNSGKASNPYHSARALWALSLAKSAGYRVEDSSYDPAVNYIRGRLGESAVTDYETKAVLLHALTAAGHSDFPLANQLHRNRPSLSKTALAYLALTFAEMDRKQTAEELLTMLATQSWTDGSSAVAGDDNANESRPLAAVSWNHSVAEIRAIFALALEAVTPSDGRLKEQIDWLMAHRTGHRWSPDKATGPAMLAACRWFGRSQFTDEKYKLTVFVNDYQAKELEIDGSSLTQSIDVPGELLDTEKDAQQIRFQLTGRGRYTYQCVLGGFVPADQLKGTADGWRVTRYYQPGQRELDGEMIPRSFDVAFTEPSDEFRNDMSQLPVGHRASVELEIRRDAAGSRLDPSQRPYLVVTEPLPCGAALVENSVSGSFERFEVSPGVITFYMGNQFLNTTISYQVHGYLPGQYRVTPTLVRDAFRPEQMAVAQPKSVTVLPAGSPSEDPYRLTPTELFELGRRHFDKGHLVVAAKHLNELFNDWKLRPDCYKETVRMLLDVHLAQGPPNLVVRYFEIIIEKFPDLEIPFAKLLQVADAYHEIGEYERSYLVFRAAVEASFLRESQLAGFLESQDELMRSIEVMSGLLRQYPPEPYLAAATYALAQRVYAKAPDAATDARLREKKITRVDLIGDAWNRLDAFLTEYPEDPAADQASFSVANALLDLELYPRAITACSQYAKRYPDSDYLDSYWYIIGFCHFASGAHQEALDMCRKVSEAQRKDKRSGRLSDSPNKWQAIYILGQIHHSLGQAAAAIREYTRVEDRFVDARQAIDYFARKAIQLPEVASFRPGEQIEVKLDFRNVASCDVTVYRIDLMKFSLLRRDLSDITNINLAGIRPYYQAAVELGDGKDYRDRDIQLKLPLAEEGAYLAVCRAENLHASGMVLVTPMDLEIQEEVESGRVRATVRNTVDKRYVAEAHVKVIGTRNEDFVSGESDLRGVFVADGIRGRSMVIAQAADDGYAFFRGQQEIGPAPTPKTAPEEADAQAAPAVQVEMGGKAQLLEGLKGANADLQVEQQEQLQEVYENSVDEGIGGGFGGGFF